VYTQQATWLPTTPKGLGQTTTGAVCPSMNQLLGCLDMGDPCCSAAPDSTYTAGSACYNTATGLNVPCPVAGSVQTGAPSGNGPFGAMTFSNLNWGVLAAVLAGLVILAEMSGGKR
jgi:hypothetical protein